MTTQVLTIETAVDFGAPAARRHKLVAEPPSSTNRAVGATGGAPVATVTASTGRVPRVARLMALALRIDGLLRTGQVADYAEVATLGHVSRARVTQIMNLTHLAPDIQEDLLFLPPTIRGRDPIRDHALRPIAAVIDWNKQRKLWARVKAKALRQT
ncbi:MAG: hypothetical protein ACREJ2_08410 [Planctomycetota bacterium]